VHRRVNYGELHELRPSPIVNTVGVIKSEMRKGDGALCRLSEKSIQNYISNVSKKKNTCNI
jgi:hypothetical protein